MIGLLGDLQHLEVSSGQQARKTPDPIGSIVVALAAVWTTAEPGDIRESFS